MVHYALQMIILIILPLRSGNLSRKRLWDGKNLTVLKKYVKLWIGRRAQRATICIALTIQYTSLSSKSMLSQTRLKSANAK